MCNFKIGQKVVRNCNISPDQDSLYKLYKAENQLRIKFIL